MASFPAAGITSFGPVLIRNRWFHQEMCNLCFFNCWTCPCRLHCCWQLKHLLRGYEQTVKQVKPGQGSVLHGTISHLPPVAVFIYFPLFFFFAFVFCSQHPSCALCKPSGLAHSSWEKNSFHCLINIAWKMSLFVMWPLGVIWMRLIFHLRLQSSLFSQPQSYH